MTIIEQSRELRDSIARYAAIRRADTDARALRELNTKVREQCDALEDTVAKLAVLREEQVRIPTRLRTDRLREVLVKLRDDITSAQKRPAEAANFLRSFKKLADDALAAVESALEAHIRESQTVDAASLRQLEQIPRFAGQVQMLRDLQRMTPARAALLPPADLRAFLQRHANVRTSLRDVENLPDDVRAFLKEVDKGGARIELLTDSVREWLTAKGLMQQIRVVISTPGPSDRT